MPKKLLAAFAAAILALTLAGCGHPLNSQPGTDTGSKRVREAQVTLRDGRTVTCLTWAGYNKGGLSCDWSNAR